jgi:hypothetical protein
MSLKQRDVTGGEQLWGRVPGYHMANYLLRIISVPAESLLRARFGRRYFTMPNFIAGFFVLQAFNYSGVILAAILTFFGNALVGGISLMATGIGPGSALMNNIIYVYVFVGIFHFLEERVQWSVLGNMRHTFTEGTSWLLPFGKGAMSVANRLLRASVKVIAKCLRGVWKQKVEQAIPHLILTSNERFTERFLDPLFLFVLAIIVYMGDQTTVAIWLLISIPGLNMVTRVRYSQQEDQVLDLIDIYLESEAMSRIQRGKTNNNDRSINKARQASTVERSADVMEMLRKKAPTVADAYEAERVRKNGYNTKSGPLTIDV